MTYTDEQLGFIWRFRDKMRPYDIARVLGSSPGAVGKALVVLKRGGKRRFPISQQERTAAEIYRTKCSNYILAFDFAFDACLDLPDQPTLRNK